MVSLGRVAPDFLKKNRKSQGTISVHPQPALYPMWHLHMSCNQKFGKTRVYTASIPHEDAFNLAHFGYSSYWSESESGRLCLWVSSPYWGGNQPGFGHSWHIPTRIRCGKSHLTYVRFDSDCNSGIMTCVRRRALCIYIYMYIYTCVYIYVYIYSTYIMFGQNSE